MGLHEIIKKDFNELKHETAHCMHEKLDLWYLSEVFLFFEICMYPAYRTHRLEAIYHKWSDILTSVDSDEHVLPPFKHGVQSVA